MQWACFCLGEGLLIARGLLGKLQLLPFLGQLGDHLTAADSKSASTLLWFILVKWTTGPGFDIHESGDGTLGSMLPKNQISLWLILQVKTAEATAARPASTTLC